MQLAASCAGDPLRFVILAYPWGEADTELEHHPGPDTWQRECLEHIRDNLSRDKPIRMAIAGGVGPGKSALMAWVVDWCLTTYTGARARITANTGPQLSTTTWPELQKWRRLSLWSHWFHSLDRSVRSVDPEWRDNWRADAMTWDATNPQAFAGFHNRGKRLLLGTDESSTIPRPIWSAAENCMSDADTERIYLALGNPSESTGPFRECFPGGKDAARWWTKAIDTRTSRMTDKAQIAEWIEAYGIDSDFVRIKVLSQFPRAGSTQFISADLAASAMDASRDAYVGLSDPLILGVDVAWEGDDKTVLRVRRGLDARSVKPLKFRGLDPMQVAARIAELHEKLHFDAIFIDNGSFGGGVVARCQYLKLPARGINFGAEADRSADHDGFPFFNKAAEMWGLMKEWLQVGMVDRDAELESDLTNRQYGHAAKGGKDCIQLERKKDMKKRGLSSPDDADALALTFAYPVQPSDHSQTYGGARGVHEYDYDPYARQ